MNSVIQTIPYSRPYLDGRETELIQEAITSGKLSGNGSLTQRCHAWLNGHYSAKRSLLTTSCTSALEMAGLLLNLQPGDEVIMPSFTFVSSANAFVLRGAKPVFVDVGLNDLNIDANEVRRAITPRTKAVVPVHYAGSACDLGALDEICKTQKIPMVVDGAQVMGSTYNGRPLGCFGDMVALSFHDTKNIVAGEGGALVIHNPEYSERAEILWEKGTNRSRFLRGEVDRYTWVDVGSSFLPSEITAAVLMSQLEKLEYITQARRNIFARYNELLTVLENKGLLTRPQLHDGHNAHIYFVLLNADVSRERVIHDLRELGISTVSHYVPLHSSPAGIKYGRAVGNLENTNSAAERILRLPVWVGFDQMERVVDGLKSVLARQGFAS